MLSLPTLRLQRYSVAALLAASSREPRRPRKAATGLRGLALLAAGLGTALAVSQCGPGPETDEPKIQAQRVTVAAVRPGSENGAGGAVRVAGFLRPVDSGSGRRYSGIPGELRDYRAELALAPALLENFRAGDRVEAVLPTQGSGRRLSGRVLRLGERGLVVGLRFEARIIDHLLLEFFVYPRKAVSRFRVPLNAILNPTGDQAYVMRIVSSGAASGRYFAERVPVVVVDRAPRGGQIGIIGPIAVDDRVVLRGHANLLNGEEVRL